MVKRNDILRTAENLICGDRQETYGSAKVSHERIGKMWAAYLGERLHQQTVSATDVAAMMVLMKVARAASSTHSDNWVDVCGYAALAAEMEGGDDTGD